MNNEPKAGKGIDPEMLAAYIDNRLPPDQRARVEAQLATDPESYALLVDTLEALEDDEIKALEVKEPLKQPIPFAPKAPKSTFRKLMIAGGALAAAAAVVLAVWTQPDLLRRIRGGSAVDPELAKLVASVGQERTVVGRLSGGFPYAVLRERTRSVATENLALLSAAAELQREVQEDGASPGRRRAFGVALLQLGRYDEATREISEALALAPGDAGFQNDLAVAFLERARRDERADDWSRALAAADRAIAANPALLEAWFNRALALDGLRMGREARTAWQDYLARDGDSEWAAEARTALERLRDVSSLWHEQLERVSANRAPVESLADVSIQDAREHLERVLLFDWARQQRSGSRGAADALQQARALADRLVALGADGLAREEIDFIARSSDGNRNLIADAHIAFRSATDQLDAFEFVSGTKTLQQAVNEFNGVGSPMALRATVLLASAHRVLRDTSTAKRILAPLALPSTRCSVAAAERDRVLGLAEFSAGDFGAALGHYSKGLERYRACNELSNVAALHALNSEILSALGLFEQAWGHQREALAAFDDVSDVRIRMQIMFCAGRLALQQGLPEAALYFNQAFAAVADQAGNVPAYAEARANIAKVLLQLGRREEADAEINGARSALQAARDPAHQRFVSGELAVALASDAKAGADSVDDLEAAIRHARNANRPEILPSLYLLRSKHHQLQGRIDDARDDLRQGIDAFGAQLRVASRTWSQWSFRASGWMLYEELAELELRRGDGIEKALETLYDGNRTVFGVRRSWPEFRAFQRGLPGGSGVLFTSTAENVVSAWLVTQHGVAHHSTPIGRTKFVDLVSRFSKAAASSSRQADEFARELHDILIAPFEDTIAGLDSLAVVSSGTAGQLPWAGLKSRSGRYLVERVALRVAETELTFVAPIRIGTVTPIAVLAASTGGSDVERERLRLVKDEVRQIAKLYSDTLTLDGDTVSVATAIEALKGHQVFHFAGHAVANQDNPDLSALLLRQSGEEVVALNARMLSQEHVSPELVVLTACRTAVDQTPRGAGRSSLASVLLRAGSRAVVATLGDVPDDVAHVVGIRLHERLLSGDPLDLALRNAQLEAVGQSDFWPRTLFATFY